MLTIPHSKDIKSTGKSDLEALWESSSSPATSPNIKKGKSNSAAVEVTNILALLSLKSNKCSPAKKLFVPPSIQLNPDLKKKKEELASNAASQAVYNDILLSSLTIVSSDELKLPDSFNRLITYTYKGAENQLEAWNDFKRNVKEAKCSVAVAARFAFLFEEGKVKAKAFTGSAQKFLEETCPDVTKMPIDTALKIFDDIQASEKLSLYSTQKFFYSVVFPVSQKSTEFESSNGKRYRMVLTGNIFPFEAKELHATEHNYQVFKMTSSALY